MPADYAVKEKNSTDLDLNTESDTLDSFLDVQEVEAVDFVFEKKPVYEFFKRVFDIILSFIALIVLSPIFLIIALVIIIDDRSASPIFTQKRCGKLLPEAFTAVSAAESSSWEERNRKKMKRARMLPPA